MTHYKCYRCDLVFNSQTALIHSDITNHPIREEERR